MLVFIPFNFPFNTNELISADLKRKIKHDNDECYILSRSTCNISIKDQIVSSSDPLDSTAQPTRFVTLPTNVYSNKFT